MAAPDVPPKDRTKVLYVLQMLVSGEWWNYEHPQYGSMVASTRREGIETDPQYGRGIALGHMRIAVYTRTDPE